MTLTLNLTLILTLIVTLNEKLVEKQICYLLQTYIPDLHFCKAIFNNCT